MNALRPIGCPFGVDPLDWCAALVERIDQHAALLSHLIDFLDRIDGDCDLECDGDLEPSLGWLGTGPHQWDNATDCELDESAVAK